MKYYNRMAMKINDTATQHGWWDDDRSDGECIALMHSELSEALEALRKDNPSSTKIPEFSNIEEELADCIIRIMDYGTQNQLDIAGAIIAKQQYNETRPYKHGKRF